MISEPEMDGAAGAAAAHDVVGDRVLGERRPRSHWMWALGGMAVASALWAAAVLVYGADGGGRPDTHGYRLDADPCPSLRLSSIRTAVGPREPTAPNPSGLLRHPALDEIRCDIPLRERSAGAGSERAGYAVVVRVELHKETDPRAEFEARQRVTGRGYEPGAELESVPDLGDLAYLLTSRAGNARQEIRVLEGGAVFSLELHAFRVYEDAEAAEGRRGAGLLDLVPYRAAMISDMRELMAALKRDG
ncbi:hypothetical protein [Streptomyces sp. SM10]|uniref:hypothetical protein n=1 Tax=Streptomyces sp. SM10 TaxID=565556 RepID=UPI000CDA0AA5|nr:hypothetical protein [Streptomyces sp. SM10]